MEQHTIETKMWNHFLWHGRNIIGRTCYDPLHKAVFTQVNYTLAHEIEITLDAPMVSVTNMITRVSRSILHKQK